MVQKFKNVVLKNTGTAFPDDPYVQLKGAITAVFRSWNTPAPRFIAKQTIFRTTWVQLLMFNPWFSGIWERLRHRGSFHPQSLNRRKGFIREFLMNAQGEDVVAGIRTPMPIKNLEQESPEIYKQFKEIASNLEKHYHDMQDIEFTIEKGKLYILQTHNGKCTVSAAIRIAVDLCKEGLITKEEAVKRIDPQQLDKLLHRRIDEEAVLDVVATCLPYSPVAV